MATSSTKKPFSYCPGGINFSELKTKSPSMARRIEKHQEHMSTPSPTPQLLPSAPSPANQQMQPPLSGLPPSHRVSHTSTLPNPKGKPTVGRQRSISDLLSSSCDSQTPSQILPSPAPNNQMMGSYNPYAADRSISIPPPTPPPFIPDTPVDPVNRAASLPPVAPPAPPPPAAPPLPTASISQRPPGRPGLPPPHPVHQLLQKQEAATTNNYLPPSKPPQQLEGMSNGGVERAQNGERSASPGKGQIHQKIRITATTSPASPPANSCEPRPHPPTMAPSTVPAPPPPPPPPPPPNGMGVVAKFGVSGVPFAGKKPVRTSITLAEIRAGNSNLGPESPEPMSPQCNFPDNYPPPIAGSGQAPISQMDPSLTPDYYNHGSPKTSAHHSTSLDKLTQVDGLPQAVSQVSPLTGNQNAQSGQRLHLQMPQSPQSLHMSPSHLPKQPSPQMSPNFPPPPPLISPGESAPQLKPAQGRQPSKTVKSPHPEPEPEPFWKNLGSPTKAASSLDLNLQPPKAEPNSFAQSLNEFEAQRDLMMSPRVLPETVNSSADGRPFPTGLSQGPLEGVYTCPSASFPVTASPDTRELQSALEDSVNGGQLAVTACPRSEAGEERKINNRWDQLSAKEGDVTAQSKLNDDIKLSKPRERSVPRQQSLQKEFEGHSRTEHPFAAESQKSPARGIQSQKSMSVDTDEPEMMDINRTGRRDSNSGSVRYRPSTPRTVTPVRFTPTPKLANKGWKSPDVKPEEPRTAPINLQREEKKAVGETSEEAKLRSQGPSRNVSDSGISVESSEPDEISGKIITDQMQKIEAQMKKILSAEKPKIPEPVRVEPSPVFKVETSESASSINIDSERPSMDRVEMSGYSTCSEEELKFDDSLKVSNGGKSLTDTPIRTGSFEAMEEFEEAPEEFDLGITSYSISHPNEVEEIEKTPVPEVFDSNRQRFEEEETPYRVSPPESRYGTLEHDRRAEHLQKPVQQENNGFGLQNPMHSPFIQDHNNLFNGANMMPSMMPNMMAGMAQFPQQLPNMFDQNFASQDLFSPTSFPSPASSFLPSAPSVRERIIPIQVVRSNSAELVSKKPEIRQQQPAAQPSQTIDIPIKVERSSQSGHQTTLQNGHHTNIQNGQGHQSTLQNGHQTVPSQLPPSSFSTPKSSYSDKPSPTSRDQEKIQETYPIPPPPPPAPSSSTNTLPSRNQQAGNLPVSSKPMELPFNTLPSSGSRSSMVSPPTVRSNMTSPTTVRMSPTSQMLQSQLSQLKKMDERPVREETAPPATPQTLRRNNSFVQPQLRNRLGSHTPTFNELQFKYGTRGPSPVTDREYQKEARNTVVGELASFGGVQQASKITGPRKKPSQSPSMRLLGMLHVQDSDEPADEGVGMSQEYRGEQGRFLPPKTPHRPGGNYTRSLSSQL